MKTKATLKAEWAPRQLPPDRPEDQQGGSGSRDAAALTCEALTARLCPAAAYCRGLVDWEDRYKIGELLDRLCLTNAQVTLVMQLRETDACFLWARADRQGQLLAFNSQCVDVLDAWQADDWPFMPDRGLLAFIHTVPLYRARQHSCWEWEVLPDPYARLSQEERIAAVPALRPVVPPGDH